ncbi:ferritin-like metal-binding protein YciE [Chitinophaga skermanii]|uniref:Ferritin-like metal-binding protein YciE n=1 Tax=Chitinophaga skermanii TaxID=331697 RepID=A0A327QCM2_9BACT|nr:ferritin-like domain-containing protein [Chitinophaga skermanii]RAJ01628.1 ferritin-like metal-binding protein YciE [Chitinophaga skermanii]
MATKATARSNARTAKTSKAKEDMPNSKFHALFVEELKDIYWAEKALTKALPKLMKAATSDQLKFAINDHLDQTREHVNRLEQIFQMLDRKAVAKKCEAMEGLIAEGNEVIEDTETDSMVRDCALIIACQKVEHYEIASYGSLRTLANIMGHSEIAHILESTLQEEKDTDSLLTNLAVTTVNEEAVSE